MPFHIRTPREFAQDGCTAEVALSESTGAAADDEPRILSLIGVVEALQRAGVRQITLDGSTRATWVDIGGATSRCE